MKTEVVGMVELMRPSLALLPAYEAALRSGWSPNNIRDVSGEQIAKIEADATKFVDDLEWAPGQVVTFPDGTTQIRIPGPVFWIWDRAFCGQIGLRYLPGTLELPAHVVGHVGYAVVPERRRQGIATAALRLLLPIAHGLGLERVSITADVDNVASQRVILAAGGVLAAKVPAHHHFSDQLLYWVQTAR